MAEQIVSWMQEKAAYFPSRETLHLEWVKKKNYPRLLAFTDEYFWQSLREIVDNPTYNAFPEYIVSLCNALLNHQECEFIAGSEIKLITGDEQEFKNATGEEHLATGNDELVIFSDQPMTKHVPIQEFKESLGVPDDEMVEEATDSTEGGMSDAEKYNEEKMIKRLYEGICVYEENDEPHLLCDDPCSLMKHLYKVRLLIIRKYRTVKKTS